MTGDTPGSAFLSPPASSARAAICYLLADPAPERPVEAVERRLRSGARRIPFLDRVVRRRWPPSRRLGYGAGLRASVRSLRRRHRELPPVVVLVPRDQPPPLADVDEVIRFDPGPYGPVPPWSSYFGREIYYKLEVFHLRGYDRIVFLDCDTVILDDISPLWDLGCYADRGLYAVRETAEMGVTPDRFGRINTGVMVINRALLGSRTHLALLDIARTGTSPDGSDQGVLELYLARTPDVEVGELDDSYNVLVVVKQFGDWARFQHRIKILHYVNHRKPWAADHHLDPFFDGQLKRIWDDAYRLDFACPTAGSPAA
jgi:hypothetical protein